MRQKVKQILRWSERYTKTDMLYLASSGFWSTTKYVFGVITGLITTIALANLITPQTYGTYQFIISLASIIGIFTLSGIGLAINRAVAQGKPGTFRYGVRLKLLWSSGIVIVGTAIAGYYFLHGNFVLGTAITIATLSSPLIVSFRLYEQYLQGKKYFKQDALIEMVRHTFPFAVLLTTLFITDNIIALIAAYFISNAVSYIFGHWYVLWLYRPPFQIDTDAFRFGKHLTAMSALGQLVSHVDKVLIWHFLGPVSVATFTLAQLATRYSGGVINSITGVALPKLAQRDLPTLQQTLPRKVMLFSGVMGIGAIVYVLLAPFLFAIVFPLYPEAVPLTQVLALSLLFVPNSLYTKALAAHAQTKALYISKILHALSKILLLVTLLPLFGLWGAVWTIILNGAIGLLINYTLFTRARVVTAETP